MAKFYFNASARRWPGHRAALFHNPTAQHINNRSHCLYRRPAIRAQAMRAWATQEEPAADEDQTEPSE
ncbi:hypothetical protein [Pseudomonas aeruginosa]|uniref:hypothetical protein n=1 Tax=Pseudomonas aeruginosa TaxID=287 RepID=UPI0012FE3940|nr:hypothetical protein [Pseudomonas aeruginosa]